MTSIQVKKTVTSYEYMVVTIPNHLEKNDCNCKRCINDAITIAIKKNEWYTNDDEFETMYEGYI